MPGPIRFRLVHGLVMDTETKGFLPPYNLSWATFLSTLERMAADPPSRVDRSYLDSQSGTVQTYLIGAFKAFGLINEDSRPTETVHLFADPEKRKGMIADLISANYETILALGQTNSTPGELAEAFGAAFPTITGESRVKAIRFFLSAATYAGIKLSPLWKAPKAPRGSSAKRSGRTKASAQQAGAAAATAAPAKPKPQTMDEAKLAYFDLLINHASADAQLDPDVLDRIERLVGIAAPGGKAGSPKRASRAGTGATQASPSASAQDEGPEDESVTLDSENES